MRDERNLLAEFLADHPAECDACGHGLHGIMAERCPECGRGLRLTVKAADHTLAAWLFGIVALALGAGFDGVMSVVMTGACVVEVFIHEKPGPPTWFLALDGAFATTSIILVGLIILLAHRRKPWCRAGNRLQWARALAIAGAVFAVHAAVAGWFVFRR